MKCLRIALFAAVLTSMVGFSACSTDPKTTSGAPPASTSTGAFDRAAAQRDVFAAKEGYGVAERLATVYAQLPRCSTPAVQPCSDQAVLDQITRARNIAREALAAAQIAVDTPQFGENAVSTAVASAQAAMSAFTSIANTSAVN